MSFYKSRTVERILQNEPSTRSNDKLLILRVWEQYGMGFSEQQKKLLLGDRLPNTETIRRTRQKLQAEGKYTANLTVLNQRQALADRAKAEFGQQKQARMFDEALGRKFRDIL